MLFESVRSMPMSKETPQDDPRKQTDKPWQGNPEKDQKPGDTRPDLEKWRNSDTH